MKKVLGIDPIMRVVLVGEASARRSGSSMKAKRSSARKWLNADQITSGADTGPSGADVRTRKGKSREYEGKR
jgi:hypothetical protein